MQTTLWTNIRSFPDTKYMGSKQAILPEIMQALSSIEFDSALDAFSGSACVSYALKQMGKRIVANDFLEFAYNIAKATVENNNVKLTPKTIEFLLEPNSKAGTFVRDTYKNLYFCEEDCAFIDNTYANIKELADATEQSIAMAALCRACMKKRPRGIFTFTGKKGWDGRRDLRISMARQFIDAIRLFNACVFDNGRKNIATCLDVFETSAEGIDLVYIDTPYISPHSDCDYTRRYHFVEGLCSYWSKVAIQYETTTKKIRSYKTAFCSAKTVIAAFERLFYHFRECKLAVSYSSNGIPGRDEMIELLKETKSKVQVVEIPHKYSFGNQRHKVGNNNNSVTEYLFIAE